MNRRHGDFQSPALPTELPDHIFTHRSVALLFYHHNKIGQVTVILVLRTILLKAGAKDRISMRDYQKDSEPASHRKAKQDYKVGIWSRSFKLRIIVWISAILLVVVLALFATTYLSGFDSVFEMIDWYRSSFSS